MKGPSMKMEVMRNMMGDVIENCENNNLAVVATSSDGQWHQYGVRSDSDYPLTVHQLHRQLWCNVMSCDKVKLQTEVKKLFVVQSLQDISYEKRYDKIVVLGHKKNNRILSTENSNELLDCSEVEEVHTQNHNKLNYVSVEYKGCLTGDFDNKIDLCTMDQIDKVFDQMNIPPESNSSFVRQAYSENENDFVGFYDMDSCDIETGVLPRIYFMRPTPKHMRESKL